MHSIELSLYYMIVGNRVGSGGVSDSNTLEQKRGQFLGATLRSTGEDFLVWHSNCGSG